MESENKKDEKKFISSYNNNLKFTTLDKSSELFYKKSDEEINNSDDDGENSETKNYVYIEPIILENINLDKYFCRKDIDIAKRNNKTLKITDKGLYSITKYDDAEWISNIII